MTAVTAVTVVRRALVAMCALVIVGCASADGPVPNGAGLDPSPTTPDVAPRISSAGGPISLAPTDDRLQSGEAEAIESLGGTGAGPPPAHDGHAHGEATFEMPLFTGDAAAFANEWLTAQRAIPSHDTIDEAVALGYVRATSRVAGIGTHFVRWSQIAQPFDPGGPAMLLFDERREPPALVGYSYALQSPTQPEGFAGGNDAWHQHTGLCVANGWVVREQSDGADECEGTYIAGGDFWMAHAWVVPGWENRTGRFGPFNPKLCPPDAGTPDMARCPE